MSRLWAVLQPNDDCLERKEPTENTWVVSKAVWLNCSREPFWGKSINLYVQRCYPCPSHCWEATILLLKTTLFFLFFMFKIFVCLSTEVCFMKSFAQPEPPDSVCDESRAPTPGWTLQAMSKWWEIEQDWELQRLRCALWDVTRGDILRATIHCHRHMVCEQAQISQEPKLDLFWNRQLSI